MDFNPVNLLCTRNTLTETLANSVDPDEIPHKGMNSLLRQNRSSDFKLYWKFHWYKKH